jgi:hypothetical protein
MPNWVGRGAGFGEEEVLQLKPNLRDPRLQGISSGLGDLELHRALGLTLHDGGARGDQVPMTGIPHPQGNEIETTQFAVDAQMEQGKFSHRRSI